MPIRPENRHRYPADWPQISHRIRFERAAGRCECLGECGRGTHTGRCPNVHDCKAYGTGSKVVLTVAHLDHTPENCDPTNLRAMCQGCHLHYDRDHHRQTAAATRRAAVEQAGQLTIGGPEPEQQPELFLIRVEPVQEIAAEPGTLARFKAALDPATTPPQATPQVLALGGAPSLGWPLIEDSRLPANYVYFRPVRRPSAGPPCGNNPHHQLSPGDQAAVDKFKAYLRQRAAGRTDR
ncbi:hypothetical protein [[Kitasatospora] papulosa]|uniref:hypothetical protein n=1 Tax=[Kitasatospora] papulosa TaxID=1464011 RepID=UPI00362F42E7